MSNETKPGHTPGPRKVKVFSESQVLVLGPDKGGGRREAVGLFTGPHRLENATLDSAGPELVAVCEAILSAFAKDGWPEAAARLMSEVRAAVAKAKGEDHVDD